MLCTLLLCVQAGAQGLSAEKRTEISDMLTRILDREVRGGKTRITRVVDAGNRLTLYASIGMSYYPFRPENVTAIYDSIRSLLPASLARRRLSLVTDKHPIEELIPRIYRSGSRSKGFTNEAARPLVTRLSSPVRPTRGLAGRHIAMWQSHGRYFDQQENRWKWQRSRLWETCEDLYTQSYVLPYLVPMLERAGANVLLPRERDTQCEETIADNDPGVDAGSSYAEYTGARRWFDAGEGFAHRRDIYTECQNPFAEGTARGVQTVTDGRESRAEWSVEIPASVESIGGYAFRGCRSLTTVNLSGNVEEIGVHTFFGCDQATIYTDAESIGAGWDGLWNSSYRPVVWGCELAEDGGYIVSVTVGTNTFTNVYGNASVSSPVREGYVFAGWALTEGGNVVYNAGDAVNAREGTILYAVWQQS